ncbi:PIN domain-containing protein [Modestobacter sp. I12A-02628]|uniref:Ribonuclease VapC n=1 Tax=Goekera deserti TaxID=2497753 RepID=A0A7K3WCG3_9ACTN|nr:type II toxin-antitoxin system VapC family toxin [Goekera deserti]MPQ98583.1 PIN domain-containing protein [Goekera deserti]NDI49047.1 PIN domain-containing protein [Goekera deserti]NEL54162.1 type II toxin-antitoxin system VapC family toxin [Goekera deserti]
MKVVDANVLLYAVNTDSHGHARSKAWLEAAFSGREVVGLPWVVILAFLRISTRAGLFDRPLTVPEAMEHVELWLAQPGCVVIEPTARHLAVLQGLLDDVGTGGNLVNDAHLAALAVEHGATVVSWDRDFARFAGVRTELPG